jgi:alpha-tubulin suppressor-like RCC1 family protein
MILIADRLPLLIGGAGIAIAVAALSRPAAAAEKCETTPMIAADSAHGGFVDAGCRLWMWGWNEAGQLASADKTAEAPAPMRRPPAMPPLRVLVVANNHSFGIAADGRAYAWGSREYLTCNGDFAPHSRKPQRIPGVEGVRSIAGSRNVTLFLLGDGTVREQGCINHNTNAIAEQPVDVAGLPPVQAIAVGSSHRLALSHAGDVYYWGDMAHQGQHDTTNGGARPVPVKVAGLPKIVAVAAGSWHSVALDTEGGVWTWGADGDSALGLPGRAADAAGTPRVVDAPTRVPGVPPARAIAATWFGTLMIARDGRVFGWGNFSDWTSPVPTELAGLRDVATVYPGGNAAVTAGVFARLGSGEFVVWHHAREANTFPPQVTTPGETTPFRQPAAR